MKNYITMVKRVEGEGVKRVETEFCGITVAFMRKGPAGEVIPVSRRAWSGSTWLPDGVMGEMLRQAAAVFMGKRRVGGGISHSM